MQGRSLAIWTFAVTSVALLMVMLDNLVVSTALHVIRAELSATSSSLEWTVNAYTLTFAVLSADGRGARRPLRTSPDLRHRRRHLHGRLGGRGAVDQHRDADRRAHAQGVGAAIVIPLTLTLLSAAVPPSGAAWPSERGAPSAASPSPSDPSSAAPSSKASTGTGSSGSTCPSASPSCRWPGSRLRESHGPADRLDLRGLALASAGLLGIVWALINGNPEGWTSPAIVAAFASAWCSWSPSWPGSAARPRRCCRCASSADRAFTLANVSSLLMYFGMFGSIFLLAQFLQVVRVYSPLQAGLRPSCPGRSHRCSWRPSRARCPIASAAAC